MKNRRVVIPHPGPPEVLKIIEEDIPEPKGNEVRVKVLTAGVARADTLMRRGQYPEAVPSYPFTPGYDICGVVETLGESVSGFYIGDLVVALTETGGYADYVCLPEDRLVIIDEKLDPAKAACLPLNYITAYQTFHRFAGVKPRESVLIHAAASGVGTAQLQLGRLIDLEMLGTASIKKHDLVSDLGAIPLDYKKYDFVDQVLSSTDHGVDAAFDPVGGSHIYRSFKSMNENGRLIVYGEMAITGDQEPSRDEIALHHDLPILLDDLPGNRIVKWYECFVENRYHPDWYKDDLSSLVTYLRDGDIDPIIAEILPLTDAKRAHELIETSAIKGKIVLEINKSI